MVYLFGFIGFCVGFYAGLMMLKPTLRRYSAQQLRSDKALAKKVGWIPWLTAFIGMGLSVYGYELFYSTW